MMRRKKPTNVYTQHLKGIPIGSTDCMLNIAHVRFTGRKTWINLDIVNYANLTLDFDFDLE
jgi:hypothetical protein